MTMTAHVPVLAKEALEALAPRPDAWIVDATFGAGGHSRLLLEASARVLAIDRDPEAAQYAPIADEDRFRLVRGDFRELDAHLAAEALPAPEGVLLDLGISSMQIDQDERGFAFRSDGPLDMRMGGAHAGESAADVVNERSMEDLAAVLYRYGEERHSRRIARAIVEARDAEPIRTTVRLAEVVRRAYPGGPRREHPARRTFQALRILVNDELAALEEGLEAAARVLAPDGRLVVISYHSLEDRIVKHFLQSSSRLEALHKKPLTPPEAEAADNPRSRSAKLRAARKVRP